MGIIGDFKGTSESSFQVASGVRLKDNSGNLIIRNTGDSADAEVTTSKVNISGDNFVINSDAAGSGNDWTFTFSRSSSQTAAVTLTLPVDDGSSGQVLCTNGSGVLSWASAIVTETIILCCSPMGGNLTTGTLVAYFVMPYAATLTGVRATVTTAPAGSTITVDINEGGTSVLSTKITIDAGETDSDTAATAPVISDSALASGSQISVDIDQVGSTTAGQNLNVHLTLLPI